MFDLVHQMFQIISSFLKGAENALFTCGLAAALFLMVHYLYKKLEGHQPPTGTHLPPIPPTHTILGHVEVLRYDFYRKALEWAKQTGPVFRLRVYLKKIVVLNNFEVIKRFYNSAETLNRSNCFIAAREHYTGVGTLNDDLWVANRRFCVNMLRDVGFAKTAMEDNMMVEFGYLAKKIGDTLGKPVNVVPYIMSCAFNNVASFFYGGCLEPDHPTRLELHQIMNKLGEALHAGPIYEFLPGPVRGLFCKMPFTRNGRIEAAMRRLENFSQKQIQHYRTTMNPDDNNNFIAGYTRKIQEIRESRNPMFTDRYLVGNVNAFLIGGTFSTTGSMHMHLINFAKCPDTVQARVQREIDEVIGPDRPPTWEDRKKMPFTLACVWELDRWKTGSVLGIPRECSDNLVVDDYFIPKGTIILPNIWAVHHDPSLWKDPHKFVPERFLNEDGSIWRHKPEYLIPFSTGRRTCPGGMFATMEIFLMVTYLLQKYRVEPENSIDLDLDSEYIPPEELHKIRLRFLPRHGFTSENNA